MSESSEKIEKLNSLYDKIDNIIVEYKKNIQLYVDLKKAVQFEHSDFIITELNQISNKFMIYDKKTKENIYLKNLAQLNKFIKDNPNKVFYK